MHARKHLHLSFLLVCVVILLFAFVIRFIPVATGKFYFTIDQGRDAIAARDILHGHSTLVGAQTDILHVYHGAGWFYLLAVLYLVGGGSPFAPLFFHIVLNVSLIAAAMYLLQRRYGQTTAVLAGIALAVFTPFYETSWSAVQPASSRRLDVSAKWW